MTADLRLGPRRLPERASRSPLGPFRRSITSLSSSCIFSITDTSILFKILEKRTVMIRPRSGRMFSGVVEPKGELDAAPALAIEAQTLQRCVFIHPVRHHRPLQAVLHSRMHSVFKRARRSADLVLPTRGIPDYLFRVILRIKTHHIRMPSACGLHIP